LRQWVLVPFSICILALFYRIGSTELQKTT
jgi:hypothetical protein